MSADRRITITPEHLKLLAASYISWDDCEFGAPEVNPKRPYGNSDVVRDIHELLGWGLVDEADERDEINEGPARAIHEQMRAVLQIAVQNVGDPLLGDWVAHEYLNKWARA